MKVISLFDGISCGREALKRAGIPVEAYYASEVDKYAMQISKKNWPDIIQIGDVRDILVQSHTQIKDIDLLIGGSPCQGFSFAGKQLNFEDPRSKLFFEFVRILNEVKPKYFLLENVKMKKEYQDIISKQLGVEPIEINSNLVSAQNRRRLYWTNIPGVTQPEDKGILLKDIVHEHSIVDREKSHAIIGSIGRTTHREYFKKNQGQMAFEWLNEYIVPFDKTLQILDKEVQRGKVGYFRKDSQANRVYYIHDKAITLTGDAGGGAAKMSQYLFDVINKTRKNNKGGIRNNNSKSPTITKNSWEQNNHLLFGCITPDRINKRQNGQRFSEGKKFYTLTSQDKHGILVEGYIRKLTPIECERLQTLPDNYTEVSNDLQIKNIYGNIKLLKNNDLVLWKNVLSQIAKEKKKQISVPVLCTTKDIKDTEILNYLKRKSVNIVISWQSQENCATNIIKIGIGTETHFIQIKLENIIGKQLEVNTDIYEMLMENGDIEMLLKNILKENLEKMRLFIISILTNLIIGLKTFIFVQDKNTCIFTTTLKKLLENYSKGELLVSKMENISLVSNTQRYKALGNGWTVDVIAHILSFIK